MRRPAPSVGGRPRPPVLLGAAYLVALVVVVTSHLGLYDRLPEPMATHFGADGRADGFLGRAGALWAEVGLLAGLGVLLTLLASTVPSALGRRLLAATGTGTAALLVYILAGSLLANADAADATEVVLPLWQLAVGCGLAAAVGAAAWLLAGPGPAAAADDDPEPPVSRMELREGEAAVWSRTVGSRVLAGVTVAVISLGAGLVVLGVWPAVVVLLAAALLVGALTSVRVMVDQRGITVAPLLLPRPRLRVPLARIERAVSREVSPFAEFGGWGYRIRPGVRGVLLRSGEGLSARLRDGGEFVVTVDDSATAAALLNGLVERGSRG